MSNVKTIAFVSDAIFPYNKGGKETRLHELSTKLARLGFDVHIYCMKWWKGESVKKESGVYLHGICPNIPLYDGQRRSIKQSIFFGLSCFKLLKEDFDIADVDHMPFFPLYAVRVVCWIKRKKMIGTWNEVWGKEYWREYLPGFKSHIASLLERFSIKLPDTIVSISPLTSEKLVTTFKVPKKELITLVCGYDKEKISSAKVSLKKSDVIFVGRLLNHKHVDMLVQSIKELKKVKPDVLCRIVGIGPEENALHLLVQKLSLQENIIFHGELKEQSEVFSLMKASKVFVLPSTREGFGIVVLEANACGLPVVTIDHPDNASKFIAQLVSDLNPKSLSEHVLFLLKNAHNKEIQSKIDKNLKKFEWDSIVENYVSQVIV